MSRGIEKCLLVSIASMALFAIQAEAQLASRLYGVTGDGGTPPETLYVLSKADASSTFVVTLGNGNDGEEIAFNPDDGLLYHASGTSGARILETINPGTLAITNIPLSGVALGEVFGLTYESPGVLLASHRQVGSSGLSTLTTGGVGTNIGPTDAPLTGLAYVGSTLYAVARDDDLLYTIDPLTGDTLTTVTITLSGYTVSGANGLATDPVDDSLWALLKTESFSPTAPGDRALATVDPATGIATLVGLTDVAGMAGIAFQSGEEVAVTPSVGTGSGSVSPSVPVSAISGLTLAFTLTPNANFVIESVGGTCGGTLEGNTYTTAALTVDCSVIANFGLEPTTKLYGITGDGGFPPETLFRLSMSDASTTFVLTLGNGNDGEEIAFNRDNGLLYHASGTSANPGADRRFESINLDTLAVTNIPLSGSNYDEVTGLTYAGPTGFLAGDRDGGLFRITPAGAATSLGNTVPTLTGLAFIGTTLYAVARNDTLLRTINPANGATLSSVAIIMPGYTLTAATGLVTNPDDNVLWALLTIAISGDRALATIDPITGIATYIGTVDVPGMAGIAFEFIPCNPCEVTPSVGGGPGTITPSTVQNVAYGATRAFTLTPDPNYHVDFVTGTCGGSLAGNVFTTAPIYTHCEVIPYFTIDTFNLTYTAGAGGTISGTSPQTVDYGSNGTQVTAVPNAFHSFVSWSDGVLTASRTDTNITANRSVTANFAINTYTVTSSVGTASGSISPLGGQQIAHGQTTQLTLTPTVGYNIASVGGTCGGSRNLNTYTTNAITAPCTVVANFAINTYTLTYTAGANGTISGTSPQLVQHGSNGTQVTAVPNANYQFVSWSDGVLTAARTDTNITANRTVTASFQLIPYPVTPSVGTPSGSISPSVAQQVSHGQTTQFTLTPTVGYNIASVGGTCGGSRSGSIYTTNAITAPCTVVANFAINTYTLTYTAGANGTISGSSPQVVQHGSNGTQVTAVPNANYQFVSWSDGVMTAARTATNVTANLSVTASFALNTYPVTSSVGTASGSISPSGAQQVTHGQTRQFTLAPTVGYNIASVGGTCGGSLNVSIYTTNVIVAPCTVVANFAINTYTLTYTAGANGTISGTSPQVVQHGSNGTQVTAVPNANYQFVSWSDGVLTAARTATNVTANLSVTASFQLIPYPVTPSVGTPSGSISPSVAQQVSHGQTTQFTLTPTVGYNIASVGGTCGGSLIGNTYTTSAITAPCTVVANFAINTYTVTSSVGTPAGSISLLGGQQVAHGQTTQFTLAPSVGYDIASVGGTCGGSRSGSIYTTNAITAPCTVVANFAINTYTLTYTAGAGGTISGTSPQSVDHGSAGTQVTAVPNPNYQFVSWSDGVLTAARTATIVTANLSVTANFAINTYTLTYTAGANGMISGTSPQIVAHGSNGTQVTAVANANHHFVSWSDGVLTAARTSTNVTANLSVTANFAIDTFSLTYTAGMGGTLSGISPQTVDYGSDGAQVTAVPNANHHFVDWSDGVLTAARTATNVMANLSVTANFEIDTYTVTSSVGTPSGSISPPGGQQVAHGQTTQFTLTPGGGHSITSVEGSCGGSLNGSTYTTNAITAPCTVVANFVQSQEDIFKDGFE